MKKNITLIGLLLISSIIQSASNTILDQKLANLFAKFEIQNHYSQELLNLSTEKDNPGTEAILRYLASGADVNYRLNGSNTPLINATLHNHQDIMHILIKKGANINLANEHGHTPLIVATLNKNTETMRILINMGADINAADNDGHTALSLAARNNFPIMVHLLLSHGAQVNTDKPRYNPIVRTTDPVIKAMIIEHQASAFYNKYLASMLQEFEALQNQLRTELAATSSTP